VYICVICTSVNIYIHIFISIYLPDPLHYLFSPADGHISQNYVTHHSVQVCMNLQNIKHCTLCITQNISVVHFHLFIMIRRNFLYQLGSSSPKFKLAELPLQYFCMIHRVGQIHIYVYAYIYIHIYSYVYTHIHVYICIRTENERESERARDAFVCRYIDI